jgi:dipeptidase E
MQLILTSSFPIEGNDAVFERLKTMHVNPRIAWIPPRPDVSGKYFPHARDTFAKHGFTRLDAVNLDQLAEGLDLNDAFDFIYLTGGDPIVFRDNALRAGLAAQLRTFLDRGGVVIGASGGAMLLTQNVALFKLEGGTFADALAARDQLGALAFVDYELLPHANRFDAALVGNLRDYAHGASCNVMALNDGAAVLHTTASDYECIGVVARYTET